METEKKYKEKVSTTVLTAIFIENSYGYKYSLKLFSNPIKKKKQPNNYETGVQTNNSYGCDNFEKMSIMN